MTLRFLLGAFCIAMLTAGRMYQSAAQEFHPRFQHFNVEDGLSQGTITAILQDHKGFMWIGTNDGLNSFDGVEFKTYRHIGSDPGSLGDNRILCLHEDHEHVLWVGTQGGLFQFDRATGRFLRFVYADGAARQTNDFGVTFIHETISAGKRVLLVAVPAISLVNRETRTVSPFAFQIPDNPGGESFQPQTVAEDHKGTLWIGCFDSLFTMSPEKRVMTRVGDERELILCILVPHHDTTNTLWVGTRTRLLKIAPGNNRPTLVLPYHMLSLLEDHKGRIWVGTSTGLFILDNDGNRQTVFTASDDEAGLTDNTVSTLYEDAAGAVWVGTYSGLNRFDEHAPAFGVYRHETDNANSLGYDFVMPIMEDQQGDIWFGTFGKGVSILHKDSQSRVSFTSINKESSSRAICGDNVRSLLQDRTGIIWIGTDNGLSLYNPATKAIRSFTSPPPGILHLWVESMCVYFYHIEARQPDGSFLFASTKKMVLIK
jgi:ligand-binding sensor domain-containing protein